MGLWDSLSVSRNSLLDSQKRMNIISRNLSGANNLDYSHRTIISHFNSDGSAYSTVERDADDALLMDYFIKSSNAHGSDAFFGGMQRLDTIYNAKEFANSPAKLIAKLKSSMEFLINNYNDPSSVHQVVSNARDLAHALNFGSDQIKKISQDADNAIKDAGQDIKSLLQKLENVQSHIVGNQTEDVYSFLDERDAILKQLSSYLPITVNQKENGEISLYTVHGITLFDKHAYDVDLVQKGGPKGDALTLSIDGVKLDSSMFTGSSSGGSLAGLLKFRDEVCVTYENQLNEMAKTLNKMFMDKSGKDSKDSLFILSAQDKNGLNAASTIKVNEGYFDDLLGKDDKKLKAKLDQLKQVFADFSKPMKDYKNTALADNLSILDFSKDSLAWIGDLKKDAKQSAEYDKAMFNHTQQSLSNAVGVNKDNELSLMLQVEQSYGASAKLISAIGKMLDDILAAVR